MAKEFYSAVVSIPKGERESTPQYLGGSKIRALGLPVDKNGLVNLSGTTLGFYLTFDGFHWSSANDPTGKNLLVPTRVDQLYKTAPSNLESAGAILPLSTERAAIFDGVQTVILVSNSVEAEDRQITIFFEPNQ